MKRTLICLLGVLTLATVGAAQAQSAATEITASGSASVSLPPDMATIHAAVETTADNANDAVAQNNVIYGRVVASLEKLGVARSDVTLEYYNVSYNPRPKVLPPNPDGERFGYTVSRGFAIKVRRIGDAGRASDACVSAGATSINGVTLGLSNPATAREQATAKAVADARANADAIARAAALHVTGIKSIELTGAPSGPVPLARAAAVQSAPTQFDQSNVSVTVSVSVVFRAEP
jgi:uncharacterized protein YggE